MQPRDPQNEALRLVPWWSIVLAVAIFIAVQAFFYAVVMPHERTRGSIPVAAFYTVLLGLFFAFHALVIGYVSRDARRRAMNPWLWMLIIIALIPAGVGFIIYFMLRQPTRMACPRCLTRVENDYNFCPGCRTELNPTCTHCKRTVHAADVYCPYCGGTLDVETAAPMPQRVRTV
jgi:RNA polymerase subunit RPABC4/transcription elongation factor Spt4